MSTWLEQLRKERITHDGAVVDEIRKLESLRNAESQQRLLVQVVRCDRASVIPVIVRS